MKEYMRRAQDKYQKKFKMFRVNFTHEFHEKVKSHCEERGISMAQYTIQAIEEKMERDAKGSNVL